MSKDNTKLALEKLIGLVLGLIAGMLLGFVGYYFIPELWPEPRRALGNINEVRHIHLSYAVDFNDDKKLVGAAHNVFVVKINRQVEIRDYNLPVTMFEGEVLYNIKGNLEGDV